MTFLLLSSAIFLSLLLLLCITTLVISPYLLILLQVISCTGLICSFIVLISNAPLSGRKPIKFSMLFLSHPFSHSLCCPVSSLIVSWHPLWPHSTPVISFSGSHVWRFPNSASCTQRALIPGPSLLWSLWRDAVRTGQTRAQVWRWGKLGDKVWIRKDDVVCKFIWEMNCNTHQICSISSTHLPGFLIHAAPCRMWTKLPQALCIQHPKQLQWSSETASVHHLSEQQPVPASLHHWVSVQCRDGLHVRRGHQPHPLTHTNGIGGFMHTTL